MSKDRKSPGINTAGANRILSKRQSRRKFLIKSGGVPIGAIGVSGAPLSSEDETCALAGLAKIQPRLDPHAKD